MSMLMPMLMARIRAITTAVLMAVLLSAKHGPTYGVLKFAFFPELSELFYCFGE